MTFWVCGSDRPRYASKKHWQAITRELKKVYTASTVKAATRRRGHFPDEDAALKVLYLTVKEGRTNTSNPTGQINGWKSILNVLAMTYGERLEINKP